MSYERVKTFQRLIRENRKKNRAHTQELHLTYDQWNPWLSFSNTQRLHRCLTLKAKVKTLCEYQPPEYTLLDHENANKAPSPPIQTQPC